MRFFPDRCTFTVALVVIGFQYATTQPALSQSGDQLIIFLVQERHATDFEAPKL